MTSANSAADRVSLLANLNQELAQIPSSIMPALVQIGGGRGHGAGTIWHHDGLILTNAHVVAEARSPRGRMRFREEAPVITTADGRRYQARLVAKDEKRDLAALAVDAHDLPAVTIGYSTRLRPGDWVMALGHPWGVLGAVTAGTVIDVGRPNEMPSYPGDLIQVGLQLRPGHSGGPMVDAKGHLVGINCMIAGPVVGLAIPVDVAKRFLREQFQQSVTVL